MSMPVPLTDAARIDLFVKPCGRLLDERVDSLARIYAGVMAGGQGYQDTRIVAAREACIDFLKMIDPMDAD